MVWGMDLRAAGRKSPCLASVVRGLGAGADVAWPREVKAPTAP